MKISSELSLVFIDLDGGGSKSNLRSVSIFSMVLIATLG
jgi:hypothetical protein